MVAVVFSTAVVLGQTTDNAPVQLTACTISHRTERRIVSNFEIVEFYVPRFAKMKKVADVDYVEYYIRYGPEQDKLWLKFMFGGLVRAEMPHDPVNTSIKWTTQKWGCHQDENGTDWSGISTDGRRWRLISIPFGFAAYEGMPPKAADYFDKILNTMCCGKDPYWKK